MNKTQVNMYAKDCKAYVYENKDSIEKGLALYAQVQQTPRKNLYKKVDAKKWGNLNKHEKYGKFLQKRVRLIGEKLAYDLRLGGFVLDKIEHKEKAVKKKKRKKKITAKDVKAKLDKFRAEDRAKKTPKPPPK